MSVIPVGLIPIALAGRVVVKVGVITVQVVLVNTVRLISIVLPEKTAVRVSVSETQVVSTVRLILIAVAGKIVVTANAKTVAWGLLVPLTLTVEIR